MPYILFLFVITCLRLQLPSDNASQHRPCFQLQFAVINACSGLAPYSKRTCMAHIEKGPLRTSTSFDKNRQCYLPDLFLPNHSSTLSAKLLPVALIAEVSPSAGIPNLAVQKFTCSLLFMSISLPNECWLLLTFSMVIFFRNKSNRCASGSNHR